MPATMNRTHVPLYAGPAFLNSPPASALPMPKSFLSSLDGSGAQRDAEGTRDGNEAVSVTSDKSHEGKGAVSETEAQDGPVDEVQKPEATSTASHQGYTACEDQTERINDNDEDDGMKERQPESENEEDEELQRRQQVIIDNFEAQTTTTQAAPPQATIPAHVYHAAQAMQHEWLEQQIRTTEQVAAVWLAAYHQSTNQILQLRHRWLERNLAKQEQLRRRRQWLDEFDEQMERRRIRAVENEGPRRTGNNCNEGNGVAGIEGGSGFVRSTTVQESEGTTGGKGMVPPKDNKEGDEAEGAEYLMEIGEIDSKCCCSMM